MAAAGSCPGETRPCKGPKVVLGRVSRRCYLEPKPTAQSGQVRRRADFASTILGSDLEMSTMAATSGKAGGMTKDERFVIFASSLGTVFEWYDFYLYGSLAASSARSSSRRNPTGNARHLRAARLRRRLPGASVRRDRVRPPRRHRRPQIHLPGHHPDHGPVDLHRRPAAQRCHRSASRRRSS